MHSKATIIEKHIENPYIFHCTLHAPEIAKTAQPGQFLLLRIGDNFDPLLRRPLSIMDYDRESGDIKLAFKVKGIGTAALSALEIGEEVNIIGPQGKGFNIDDIPKGAHLVAGGMGITPLFALAKELQRRGKEPIVLAGYDCMADMCGSQLLADSGIPTSVATFDTNFGVAGTVMNLLDYEKRFSHIEYICACGPDGMLKAVENFAKENEIPGQICLNSHLGCGQGGCMVCSCIKEDGDIALICTDGPVFEIGEVKLNG